MTSAYEVPSEFQTLGSGIISALKLKKLNRAKKVDRLARFKISFKRHGFHSVFSHAT